MNVKNTFCIATDAYSDGAAARAYSDITANPHIIAAGDGSDISNERIRGFCGDCVGEVTRICTRDTYTAAELARCIRDTGTFGADVIYAAVGSTRETALAAVKLGLRGRCSVIGHDLSDVPLIRGECSGIAYTSLCPDFAAICGFAASAAARQ